MNEKQLIDILLNRELEISNKFQQAIRDTMRLGVDSERGKEIVPYLIESVKYSLEELERLAKV